MPTTVNVVTVSLFTATNSSYPDSRVKKDDNGKEMGVMGTVSLLQNVTLASQPISSIDWSPDKVCHQLTHALICIQPYRISYQVFKAQNFRNFHELNFWGSSLIHEKHEVYVPWKYGTMCGWIKHCVACTCILVHVYIYMPAAHVGPGLCCFTYLILMPYVSLPTHQKWHVNEGWFDRSHH